MKKLIFILLALPMLATAETKQVPYSCGNGNAFTISIPVKFPAGMTVQYAWYRNDTLIEHKLLMAGEKAIAYTIPAEKAYGANVAFHFTYCLSDGCEVWTKSPTYLVTFQECEPPQASAIAGDTAVCAGAKLTYSTAYAAGVFYQWSLPAGWAVAAGDGTSSITVTADTTNGDITVRAGNGCGVGATQTLAVSAVSCGDLIEWCEGITSPGTINDDTCTDIIVAGSINDDACTGITSAGSINEEICTSIISAGSINDGACTSITSAGSIE